MSAGVAARAGRLAGFMVAITLCATPALAEVCDKVRPGWTPGTQITTVGEAVALFSTGPALVLLVATAVVLRFRSQWGGLAVTMLWSVLVSFIAMDAFGEDPTGIRDHAIREGCVGAPTLFIALVTAICIVTVLYTAPLRGRSNH
jgi:drug/metabolite transporter (DMT)-like permease